MLPGIIVPLAKAAAIAEVCRGRLHHCRLAREGYRRRAYGCIADGSAVQKAATAGHCARNDI